MTGGLIGYTTHLPLETSGRPFLPVYPPRAKGKPRRLNERVNVPPSPLGRVSRGRGGPTQTAHIHWVLHWLLRQGLWHPRGRPELRSCPVQPQWSARRRRCCVTCGAVLLPMLRVALCGRCRRGLHASSRAPARVRAGHVVGRALTQALASLKRLSQLGGKRNNLASIHSAR